MYFKVSWDQDFDDLMMFLWSKYGRSMFTENGIGDQLDLNKFAKSFFNNNSTTADISIDDNANVSGKSIIDYSFEFPKPIQKYNSHFLLWKELKKAYGLQIANKIIEQQISGEIYINDFSDVGKPYCFNFSTYDIALNGLNMSKRMSIHPPQSFQSFIRQMEQFTVYAANSTLGATGLADILIVGSYFIDKIFETGYDHRFYIGKDRELIKIYLAEVLISFIYTINWEFRGNQSPFTNISVFDKYFIENLAKDYTFIDGSSPDFKTIKMVQEIFIECMNKEQQRSNLTFPIVTACFYTDDESTIYDKDFLDYIAEQNIDTGFINIYYGDNSTLSSCCRLRSSIKNEYFNSFGAGSTKIGSLGVVTSNLPRLAYIAVKEDDPDTVFLDMIKEAVETAGRINHSKRKIIKKRIELHSMPLYSLGHMDLTKQYSTFGITGLNEALEILGYDILSEDGEQFVIDLLELINSENDKMTSRFSYPHNCEQVPAESSAVKLATKDNLLGYQSLYDLYSNQFIPLTKHADMLDRLRLQGKFDKDFSGGAICHINVGEKIKSKEKMIDLMEYAAKCGVVYWAINYALKRCKNNHIFIDEEKCPICGEEIDHIITRVVGFFTKVDNWNKTRRDVEWKERQFYKEV